MHNEYIRGFFDGEGCIFINGKMSGTIQIGNTEKSILDNISNNLTRLGIKNKIYVAKKHEDRKPVYVLSIGRLMDIYRFYTIIGTLHPDKDKIFQGLFQDNKRLSQLLLDKDIIRLRQEKFSLAKIAHILGLDKTYIFRRLHNST